MRVHREVGRREEPSRVGPGTEHVHPLARPRDGIGPTVLRARSDHEHVQVAVPPRRTREQVGEAHLVDGPVLARACHRHDADTVRGDAEPRACSASDPGEAF